MFSDYDSSWEALLYHVLITAAAMMQLMGVNSLLPYKKQANLSWQELKPDYTCSFG